MVDKEQIASEDYWVTPDDFDALMRVIRIAWENEYLSDDIDSPVYKAAKCLIEAWNAGCVRIERPLK